MRAVSKKDYAKGGNIPSYNVLKVITDGGEFNAEDMYYHDYDEDTVSLMWEERRYEIAKGMMCAIVENGALLNIFAKHPNPKGIEYQVARQAINYADALIEELKNEE